MSAGEPARNSAGGGGAGRQGPPPPRRRCRRLKSSSRFTAVEDRFTSLCALHLFPIGIIAIFLDASSPPSTLRTACVIRAHAYRRVARQRRRFACLFTSNATQYGGMSHGMAQYLHIPAPAARAPCRHAAAYVSCRGAVPAAHGQRRQQRMSYQTMSPSRPATRGVMRPPRCRRQDARPPSEDARHEGYVTPPYA